MVKHIKIIVNFDGLKSETFISKSTVMKSVFDHTAEMELPDNTVQSFLLVYITKSQPKIYKIQPAHLKQC